MKRLGLFASYKLLLFFFAFEQQITASSLLRRPVSEENAAAAGGIISQWQRSKKLKLGPEDEIDIINGSASSWPPVKMDLVQPWAVGILVPRKEDRYIMQSQAGTSLYSSSNIGRRIQREVIAGSGLSTLQKRTSPDEQRVSPSWINIPGLLSNSMEVTNRPDPGRQPVGDGSSPSVPGKSQAGPLQQTDTRSPSGRNHPPISTFRSDLNPQAQTFSPPSRISPSSTAHTENSPGISQRLPTVPLAQHFERAALGSPSINGPKTSPISLDNFMLSPGRRTQSRFFPDPPPERTDSRFFPDTPKSPPHPYSLPEERNPIRPPAHRVLTPVPLSIPVTDWLPEISPPSLSRPLSPSRSPPGLHQQQQTRNISPHSANRFRGAPLQIPQASPPYNSPGSSPPGFRRQQGSYTSSARRQIQLSPPIPIPPPPARSPGRPNQQHPPLPQHYPLEAMPIQIPPHLPLQQQTSHQWPASSLPPSPPRSPRGSPPRTPPAAPHTQQTQPIFQLPRPMEPEPPFPVRNPIRPHPQAEQSSLSPGQSPDPNHSFWSKPLQIPKRQPSPPRESSPAQQTYVVTPFNTKHPPSKNGDRSPK